VSLKTVKKKGIHDYESIMKGVEKLMKTELSTENVELISQYDMEMVRQSITSIASRITVSDEGSLSSQEHKIISDFSKYFANTILNSV
jgi:hypothetical protein